MFIYEQGKTRFRGNYGAEYLSQHPHLEKCISNVGLHINDLRSMVYPNVKLDNEHMAIEIKLLKACADNWLTKPPVVCHLCLQLSQAISDLEKSGGVSSHQREYILRSIGWAIGDALTDKKYGKQSALGSFLRINNPEKFKAIVVSIDDEIDTTNDEDLKVQFMVLKRLLWIDDMFDRYHIT